MERNVLGNLRQLTIKKAAKDYPYYNGLKECNGVSEKKLAILYMQLYQKDLPNASACSRRQ